MRLSTIKTSSVFAALVILLSPMLLSTMASTSKTTTIWSGTVTLPDGYLVHSNQVLVINAGTTVLLGEGERLGVDGRLTVQGTQASPVTFGAISGDHQGIQFNSSSKDLGSVMENITILDSEFGITIYSSNPSINNVTILNADKVAVDMFSGASPLIRDIVIDGGGQDIHGSSDSWRYGIGISAGDFSAPIIEGAQIGNLITRGVNIWYNSGGLWSDLSIHNITGATLAASCAIWVEDSIPLISGSNASKSDNGIIVRHISQDSTTRPTFLNTKVEDNQYRGVLVERFDHTNFSNLQTNALFDGLQVSGTGGPDAKTPGLGIGAAFDVNTSGVKVTNALIQNNAIVGFRAYTTDSSTSLSNITIRNNGPESPSKPHEGAGLLFRSTSWTSKGPAEVSDLVVENSTGSGVVMAKGGVIGENWNVSGNAVDGVSFVEFHPEVTRLVSRENNRHGVSVVDSSNVELSFVNTFSNGNQSTGGAGINFQKSNYVMSGGKNVSCIACVSEGDFRGIVVRDSIDLRLISTSISEPQTLPALDVNNTNTIFAGSILIDDMSISSSSMETAVKLDEVDAEIRGLDISARGGMFWRAKGDLTSHLSNSVIFGSETKCLDLYNHIELIAEGVRLFCDESHPFLEQSHVNFTDSNLIQSTGASESFFMNSESHLRWISSEPLLTPAFSAENNILDIMWFVDIHTINQNLLNIPLAEVNISFDHFEGEVSVIQPYSGALEYGPFVGKRWTPVHGWSANNTAHIGCDYDSVHNDSEPITIDQDKRVYCRLELSNQPPFIIWESPIEGDLFSSGSEIIFDARESWDLDFDDLTFNWNSNIDGDLISACPQQKNSNSSFFVANHDDSTCISDGSHQISLEVCDSTGHCVNETRGVELVNLPPVLSVGTAPPISSWGTLYLGKTANVTINLNGTFDPEGGDLWCWAVASYEEEPDFDPDNPHCPNQIIRSFTQALEDDFTVSVFSSDGVNPTISWTFNVHLYNELPKPAMEVTRNGESSADWVRLDGSSTSDPEGDDVRFEFHSDIDGVIGSGTSPDEEIEWVGTLSKGSHTITLFSSDTRMEHAGQWNSISENLVVSNSIPLAMISAPQTGTYVDSSMILGLDSTGSGDWDIACEKLPDNGSGLLCNPVGKSSGDLVSVLWESNMMEEPIGSNWKQEVRLPAGEHRISLTLDDGSGPVSDQILVNVAESPPSLVLDSPVPGAQVYSNMPVLFDFRNSLDYDGDEFTVTVSSNLMGTLLEGKTTDYWYNDYLVAGTHILTFLLTDENGMQRNHSQTISVLETGPVAVISGMEDGQYLPPGQDILLSASESYDYDDDIVLYEWSVSGKVVSDRQTVNLSFQPGAVRIDLLVKDSRGEISQSSINLTVGSSAPELFELTVSVLSVEEGVPTEVLTTVRLEDPDGTTETVRGQLSSGGNSEAMYFRDDGTNGDAVEGDGIWSSRFAWIVSDGSWARVEVWAIDGELVSPGQVHTVPIVKPDAGGIESWVANFGLPTLIISMLFLSAAGIAYQRKVRSEIEKDMEVIESWSSFDPRQMDEEFDSES